MNRKESEASIAKTSKTTNRWKEVRSSLIEVATNGSGKFRQDFEICYREKFKINIDKLHNYMHSIFLQMIMKKIISWKKKNHQNM